MKTLKSILIALFAIATLSTQAQSAIGLRFNGGNISGADISYQMGMGDANRLQLDLGLGMGSDYFAFGLTGTYQWVFPFADAEGLQWFVGPGARLGFWDYNPEGSDNDDNGINIGIGGIIGMDYTFSEVPIQLSLDTRPMFNLLGSDDYRGDFSVALGVRYVF